MPRPRFERLEPARRAQILEVAAREFAEHGFDAASYNAIIERSGLSKGVFYYYFDDKEDLYLTVLRELLLEFLSGVSALPSSQSAAQFWVDMSDIYERCLHIFQEHPTALGLGRSLIKLTARGNATALNEVRQLTQSWMLGLLESGQQIGAIRQDLPKELLLSVLMGLEEGIDLWLTDQLGALSSEQITELAKTLTDLFRRVSEPRTQEPT
jgi:AcrR family transcriptional regulator